MTDKEDIILLSPKHGINPSICHCIACGKEYGLALLGKLKNDGEAPKDIYNGFCEDCQEVIDKGGILIVEVKDGEKVDNPYRTGRIVGLSRQYKERNHLKGPMAYMEESLFSKCFANVEFKK